MKIWKMEIDWGKIGQSVYNNIANAISILRIACSPIVMVMLICAFYQFAVHGKVIWPKNYSDFAFNLFLACQVSDALDVIVARLLGITSRWGAMLDRAGDKILIVPVFLLMFLYYLILAFQMKSLLAFPIAGLILGSVYLEGMLARYGLKGFKQKASVNSNGRGKAKMILQCVQSSYWMLGFLSPEIVLNFHWAKITMDPLAIHNLIVSLVLLSAIIAFTIGSIAGYKSLPEYKKLLGENNS